LEKLTVSQTKPALPLPNDDEVRQIGRLPGDDFFCQRYQVWYASMDCALRTRFQTSVGCLQCDQGRFNLKRHDLTLRLSGLSSFNGRSGGRSGRD
jgi:hypothetical protein